MNVINKIQKSGYLDLWDIVKFQIQLHCYLNKLTLSESDIDNLTLLSINGESELTDFCNGACLEEERYENTNLKITKEIFKTPQSVRNSINKLENLKLVTKNGRSKKKISINSSLNIQSKGTIFLEIKFLRKDDSKEN